MQFTQNVTAAETPIQEMQQAQECVAASDPCQCSSKVTPVQTPRNSPNLQDCQGITTVVCHHKQPPPSRQQQVTFPFAVVHFEAVIRLHGEVMLLLLLLLPLLLMCQ
jgi:hypothetical protein